MKITIDVTQEHIDYGEAGNSESCPIALMLKEQGYKDVSVGDECMFQYEGIEWWAPLPNIAINFIKEFDDGNKVEPFSFEILAITEEERYADESE